MRSDQSDTPLRVTGFPIRTSTDRSLVGSSPWLFAASRVLHRLQAPRHPPLALCSLENQMLVLAMEFSKGARTRQRRTLATEQEQPDETTGTGRTVGVLTGQARTGRSKPPPVRRRVAE